MSGSMMTTLKLLGVGVLLGFLLGGGLAGKVWKDGRAALADQQRVADAALSERMVKYNALRSERAECQSTLDTVGLDMAVLIARVEVARAMVDYDDYNLGLANSHLAEAAKVLERGDPASVSGVRERLGATDLVVSDDTIDQRDVLLELASSLDTLLGG